MLRLQPLDFLFHIIIAWEALAESAAQALRKGAAVLIEGRLQTRSWETADGTDRYATEIVASAVTVA